MTEAVFTTPNGPPPASRLDYVVTEFDSVVQHSGFRTRYIFGLALLAIGLIAPLLIGKWPTLWRLSLEDRIRGLTKMEANPVLAAPVLALKAILCIVYYEDLAVAGEVGYRDIGFHEGQAPDPGPRRMAS